MLDSIIEILAHPLIIAEETRRRRDELAATLDPTSLLRNLENLEERRLRIADGYEAGAITKTEFERRVADNKRQSASVARKLAAVTKLPALPDPERLEEACAELRSWLIEAPGGELLGVLGALQLQVTVDGSEIEIAGSIPGDGDPRNGLAPGHGFAVSTSTARP